MAVSHKATEVRVCITGSAAQRLPRANLGLTVHSRQMGSEMTEKKSDQQVDNGGAPSKEQTGGPKVSNNAQEGGLDENALDSVSGGVVGGATVPHHGPTY